VPCLGTVESPPGRSVGGAVPPRFVPREPAGRPRWGPGWLYAAFVIPQDPDDRRRAAVQASLDALLAGASMLEATAAADAVMAGERLTAVSAPGT
jgi:hypothetical protein